jgi:hypothetical protein
MDMKEKIINKDNWFIAEIIERCEPVKPDLSKPLRRCIVWGNYHLIKAESADIAFEKAVKLGKSGSYVFKNADHQEMRWKFVGIGDLLPIYENIEDNAEIMWTDYGFISAKRSDRFVKTKKELLEYLKKKEK